MGAITFMTKGQGKTAEEAFRAARAEALHLHGHGGYSGSIAEVHRYVMLDLDRESARVIAQLIAGLEGLTLQRQQALKQRIDTLRASINSGARLTPAQRDELDAHVELDPDRLAERRTRIAACIESVRQTGGAAAVAIAHALIDANDPRIDDKWGPAGCLRISKTEFLFFGWASW